jgi:DNA repair protein RadC
MEITTMNTKSANTARTHRRINKALRLAKSGDAENVLAAALEILATRIKHGDAVNSPGAVRDYLRLLLHDRECEVFVVVLLMLNIGFWSRKSYSEEP